VSKTRKHKPETMPHHCCLQEVGVASKYTGCYHHIMLCLSQIAGKDEIQMAIAPKHHICTQLLLTQ